MAQAQIPFVSVPYKRTDDIDWIRPLKRYIAQVYQQDPENYNEETYTIHRLRQDIRGAGKDLTGRDLLYRYFGQLELLDLRFPVDEKHIKVLFTWYDAFNGRCTSQYSLAFEKASVIFNIAATLSAIAATQNRAEADGRKRAFNFFQASAGMYQYINDNFLHAPSQDLHKDTVKLLMELMLAQAQECFLENCLREKKKDGLVAKLASHTVWVYGNLVDQMGDAMARGVGIDKNWLLMCQCKQKYYQALAQLHRAAACLADHHYGEQVARLQWAEQLAKDGQKFAAQLPQPSSTHQYHRQSAWNTSAAASFIGFSSVNNNSTTSTTSSSSSSSNSNSNGNNNSSNNNNNNISNNYNGTSINQSNSSGTANFPHDGGSCLSDLCMTMAALCHEKFTVAERDNDMIYHDQVPQESVLVPIDRFNAVKAVPINDLYGSVDAGKVVGPDVFARLIPLSVHESASLYSEQKASLVRREMERCDFAKAELTASLDYMNLPSTLDKFKQSSRSHQWNISHHDKVNSLLWDQFSVPSADVKKWSTEIKLAETSKGTDGTTSNIQELVERLQLWAKLNHSKLNEISLILDTEMRACESMRVKYGDDWTQVPSGTLLKDYWQDIRNHRETLSNAQLSDTKVMNRLESISNDIAVLKQGPTSQALESHFSDSLTQFLKDDTTTTAANSHTTSVMDLQIDIGLGTKSMEQKVARVEAVLDKLNKLQKDRESTIEDLKEKTQKDDIVRLLILNKKNSGAEQQIFATQLEKYQSHQQRITAAIHQQQQAIQELGAAFKALMETEEAQKLQTQWNNAQRQYSAIVKRLSNAYTGYCEVKEALRNGIDFYTNMSKVVGSLLNNVAKFVDERDEERNTLIDTIDRTRSACEQQLLKSRLEQYDKMSQSPISSQPEVPSTEHQEKTPPSGQEGYSKMAPTLASSSTTAEESEESIRDQLEKRVRELSLQSQTPVNTTAMSSKPFSSLYSSTPDTNNVIPSLPSQYILPPHQPHQPTTSLTATGFSPTDGNMIPLPSSHQRQLSYDQYHHSTQSSLTPVMFQQSATLSQTRAAASLSSSSSSSSLTTNMMSSLPPGSQQQQSYQQPPQAISPVHQRQVPYQQPQTQQASQKPMLPPKPQEVQRAMSSLTSTSVLPPTSSASTLYQSSSSTYQTQHQLPPSMYGPSQIPLQMQYQHPVSASATQNTSFHSAVSSPSVMQSNSYAQYPSYQSSHIPAAVAPSSTGYPSQGNYENQQQQTMNTLYTGNSRNESYWHHQASQPQSFPQQQQQQQLVPPSQQHHQQQYWPPPVPPQQHNSISSNNQPSLLD